MKIHIPAFKAMAKCNAHLDHAAFDVEISDEELSAAGYEKVVRCKNCEYSKEAKVNEKGFLICPASGMEITDDDFCSYGERRAE